MADEEKVWFDSREYGPELKRWIGSREGMLPIAKKGGAPLQLSDFTPEELSKFSDDEKKTLEMLLRSIAQDASFGIGNRTMPGKSFPEGGSTSLDRFDADYRVKDPGGNKAPHAPLDGPRPSEVDPKRPAGPDYTPLLNENHYDRIPPTQVSPEMLRTLQTVMDRQGGSLNRSQPSDVQRQTDSAMERMDELRTSAVDSALKKYGVQFPTEDAE
jgi:hypothetical protein